MAAARAGATETTGGEADVGAGSSPSAPEALYASYTNEALTALAAQWDTLDVHERRALLTEVRQRMARGQSQLGTGVIRIRTERRYGRIIRQPDGRLIRIETKVVRVRPVPEAALAGRTGGYGIGFERRAGSEHVEAQVVAAPGQPAAPAVEAVGGPVRAPQAALQPFAPPALLPVP